MYARNNDVTCVLTDEWCTAALMQLYILLGMMHSHTTTSIWSLSTAVTTCVAK